METKAAALEKIAGFQSQYSPHLPALNNTIPQDGPRYQTLAGELEVVAKESSVLISSSNQGEALTFSKIVDPYSGNNRTVISMPISFRISGTYTDIQAFFNKLTTLDRLVSVSALSFTREIQTRDTTGLISFNVTGDVHYLANDALLMTTLPSRKEEQSQQKSTEETSNVPEN